MPCGACGVVESVLLPVGAGLLLGPVPGHHSHGTAYLPVHVCMLRRQLRYVVRQGRRALRNKVSHRHAVGR